LCTILSHLRRQRYVALKVCAADADSEHELKIFNHLPHDESRNVLQLLDSFSLQGPNGLHTILVHDVLGQPTTAMRSAQGGRVLSRQLAQGLAALHSNDIVHGGRSSSRFCHAHRRLMKWLDLHYGNVGVALPTLNDHYIGDILDYFGIPECIVVFPQQQPLRPEALPPYLLAPISIIDYLTKKDPTFHKAPLRAEILDLGNGQFSKPVIVISMDMIKKMQPFSSERRPVLLLPR